MSPVARHFIENNFQVQHLFVDMDSQVAGGICCCLHSHTKGVGQVRGCRGVCKVDAGADVFVTGLPCKPYSTQRAKRYAHGSVKEHENYKTMFVDFFNWLDVHDPKSGIVENVRGLDKPEHKSADHTALETLLTLNFQFFV